MTFRPPAFVLTALTLIVFLAACGSRNSTPAAIVVTFTPAFTPPASMNTGSTAGIAATVTNGPQNGTVGWSVTCGSEPLCGSFSPTSTASTIPTTYTAPVSVPTGGTVTVTATSGSDSMKSVSATITIN